MLLDKIWLDVKNLISGDLPVEMSHKNKTRILIINSFAILMVSICFIFAIVFLNMGDTTMANLAIALGVICLIPLIINFFHFYSYGILYYSFQAPIVTLLFGKMLGPDIGIGYFFVVVFSFPFIFFNPREKIKIYTFFLYNTLCLACYEACTFEWLPVINLDPQQLGILHITVLVILTLMSLIIFYSFQNILNRNELRLNLAQSQLLGSRNLKKELKSMINEDLRIPLNALLTTTAQLNETSDIMDRKTLLPMIKTNAHQLLHAMDRIRSMDEEGLMDLELHLSPHNLRAELESIVTTYSKLADQKLLKFTFNFDKELATYYYFDDTGLIQILGNLISNSLKFTDSGGIRLTVKKRTSEEQVDLVYFEVKDTGHGIAGKDLDYIFESFSQVRYSETRKISGQGLGLSTTRKLLKLYGSEIEVDSQKGQGSRFYFTLRLQRGKQEFFKQQSEKSLTGHSALLFQNAVDAMITVKVLENLGIRVALASIIQDAISLLEKETYELIIIDHQDLSEDPDKWIKYMEEIKLVNPKAPVFGIMDELPKTLFEYKEVLIKPIQREKLIDAIKNHLEIDLN